MADNCVVDEVVNLQRQLSVARNEINNLRQQIRSLRHTHKNEIDRIQEALENWRCLGCLESATTERAVSGDQDKPAEIERIEDISFRPVGVISTCFVKKRGIPRQPGISWTSHGQITLFNTVFTNPEHSLEGLDGFSHMWILFYFHKNMSSHVRAKVSPPRLNGVRTGVFGTRSPHRPCPIGMSLVQIDRIEGRTIYFSGVDMLNGTPVLDIKPYIPHYDNPLQLSLDDSDDDEESITRQLEGQESERVPFALLTSPPPPRVTSGDNSCSSSSNVGNSEMQREAPDGEESEQNIARASSPSVSTLQNRFSPRHQVRVPPWISQPPVARLNVTFTETAESQLATLSLENAAQIITDVLSQDPRSVYLRERYANQFYTFLIKDVHVSCKFDDTHHSVNVYRVTPAGKFCECGQPEWQCSQHGS